MNDEERSALAGRRSECVMISCCAGAELQVRRDGAAIVLREMYPMKSDLYERARDLRAEYERVAPR